MQVTCQIVNLDTDWDDEVKRLSFDIYHLSGWLKSSERVDKGVAKGILAEMSGKKMLFPVIVKELDNNYWDLISAYGYGGPIYDKELSIKEINVMLKSIVEFLKQKNCVSWFIRLHPILNANWTTNIGLIVVHGLTLSSDLTKTESDHWNETSKGHRYSIKKALKNGILTRIEKLNEYNVNTFIAIYQETMKKVNASSFYFFDMNYFLQLIDNLSNSIILINAILNEEVIASSIYLCCEETGIIQYHLSGTLNKYKYLAPSTLINHVARDWGRNNGYKILHFGGGLGASKDSLYQYKKGFSSQEHVFKTQRIIVNENKYEQLVNEHNFKYGEHGIDESFFPLYRRR